MELSSAHALLSGAVDYAGLFPPAALSMADAVGEFVEAQRGADAWMLGRFVLPAARLPEFADVRRGSARSDTPARLSAIVRDGSRDDANTIAAFNRGASRHRARVDAIECRPDS